MSSWTTLETTIMFWLKKKKKMKHVAKLIDLLKHRETGYFLDQGFDGGL